LPREVVFVGVFSRENLARGRNGSPKESMAMATLQISARRLILAGGFAVAIAAAPAVAAFTIPSVAPSIGACQSGETEDVYTNACTPDLVPNSPALQETSAGGLPEVDNIPCTGGNSGQCIGLAEEQQSQGPAVEPESTVGSSPTVTGSTN
jgi:hypothetical protein